ncbi:MAG: polyphosphate kinase 1 [Chitinophagaceae bacterium]
MKNTQKTIVRDLSWLSFNERVLQEAHDPSVPIFERLRFIGIYSNNLDEFFRVRVAALARMLRLGKAAKEHLEEEPQKILQEIQQKLKSQQREFDNTYKSIIEELGREGIFLKNDKQLSKAQLEFVINYFDQKVRTRIVPLMIESIPTVPLLNDKAIYLACVLGNTKDASMQRYSLISIPTNMLPRFVIIPTENEERHIILLEDIIRLSLPHLFAPFGYNRFSGYIVKVTRDAELELDNDVNTDLIEELEKSLKARKRGRATRFVFDKNIDANLLDFLVKKFSFSSKDNLVPGGRIHNFKDFMSFPKEVFTKLTERPRPFVHPLLVQPRRIMNVLDKREVMLHFPYHSFDSIIDLMREASIDPFVQSIKITCYRLANDSKLINALINAVRNGKQVTVVLELRARFDEEANLRWKAILEEEGVKVFIGLPNMKVHAKLCVIRRKEGNKTKVYGFVSTGNFNENTAQYYTDHCLLTTNKNILADAERIFAVFSSIKPDLDSLKACKTLIVSPVNMRQYFLELLSKEIRHARKKKPASLFLKLNSLSDTELIQKLYEAARHGVKLRMVVRGICGAYTEQDSFKKPIKAISIIDEYLEHGRVFIFHAEGKPKVFISSADWMVRNLDHRVETACPIDDAQLQQELIDIMNLQLAENVKARILNNDQSNEYVQRLKEVPELRSQIATFEYLLHKKYED